MIKRFLFLLFEFEFTRFLIDIFIVNLDSFYLILSDITNIWKKIIRIRQFSTFDFDVLLHFQIIFFRNERYNDYYIINWRNLLNDVELLSRLNFVKTKKQFRQSYRIIDYKFRRFWDYDFFIVHITTLNALKLNFILNYFSFFLRRLQNNSKIFIDNLKSQNQKQLRLDCESNNKK